MLCTQEKSDPRSTKSPFMRTAPAFLAHLGALVMAALLLSAGGKTPPGLRCP